MAIKLLNNTTAIHTEFCLSKKEKLMRRPLLIKFLNAVPKNKHKIINTFNKVTGT
jgi:hypothetical protein